MTSSPGEIPDDLALNEAAADIKEEVELIRRELRELNGNVGDGVTMVAKQLSFGGEFEKIVPVLRLMAEVRHKLQGDGGLLVLAEDSLIRADTQARWTFKNVIYERSQGNHDRADRLTEFWRTQEKQVTEKIKLVAELKQVEREIIDIPSAIIAAQEAASKDE